MGWIATSVGDGELRATRERRDWLVREMQRATWPNGRMVDHSGLVDYRRVWGLFEYFDEHDKVRVRFIGVGDIEVRAHQAVWRLDDESVGLNFYDCPQRLLQAAMEFEPVNEVARAWRQEVLAHHERRRDREQLVRQIEKAHPDGDMRLVVSGRPARLKLVQTMRGQTRRVMQYDGEYQIYVLAVGRIDVAASRELRARPVVSTGAALERL